MFNCFFNVFSEEEPKLHYHQVKLYIYLFCDKTTMVKVALNLTYRIQFLQLNKVEEQFQIQTDAQCLIG